MSEEEEKSGSFLKALGVGVVLTLIIEIGLGLALDIENDLVARFMMVMAGVVTILVVSLIARGIIKAALASTLTIIVSFVGPFLLPDFFKSMFPFITPLVSTVSVTLDLANTMGGLDPSSYDMITLYLQYAFVIDIAFALIIGTFAGLGIVLVAKMFSKNSGIGSIIFGILGIVLLLVGAFALPWLITGASGVFQMGLGLVNGGLYLNQGMGAMGGNFSTDNIDNASYYFTEANKWFENAQGVLQGIKGMGMFWMASLVMPSYTPLIDNGEIILDAGVDLVQAVGPFVSAMAYLNEGFQKAGGSFAGGTSSTITLLQSQSEFDEGIRMIEIAFDNITDATQYIQSALLKLESLDRDLLEATLADSGVEGADQVNSIFDAITLLNSTIDVLQVLINPLDNSPKAPLIHLLYGVNALSKAGDIIGNSSNFAGTGDLFADVVSNLTVINDALNTKTLIDFRNMNTTGFDQTLADLHSQIAGAFNFFDDASDIAIGFGNFGQQIVPILETMNETLATLNDPNLDLLAIDDAVYDNAISNLKTMATQAEALVTTAQGIENSVSLMENRSTGEYYGSLGEPAGQFASEFKGFDLVLNSQNFVYVANGLAEVFEVAKLLKRVQATIAYITDDISSIENETDPIVVANKLQAIQANVNANLTEVDTLLNQTRDHLTLAQGNFSKAINEGKMTQLGNIDTVLGEIATHITNIQGNNGLKKLQTIMADPATYVTTNGVDQTKTDMGDAVTYIGSEMDATTQAISTLSIAK